jgi:ATP synthase protein I
LDPADARIVRGAALATVPVCAVVTVAAALQGGHKGLYGALLGSALAIAFFAVTIVAVSVAGRIDPLLMLPAALGTYLLKVIGIVAFLLLLRGAAWFSHPAFALATVVGACAFMTAEARMILRARVPYVADPAGHQS